MLFVNNGGDPLFAVCLQCYTGNGGSYAARQGEQRFVQAGGHPGSKGTFRLNCRYIHPPSVPKFLGDCNFDVREDRVVFPRLLEKVETGRSSCK